MLSSLLNYTGQQKVHLLMKVAMVDFSSSDISKDHAVKYFKGSFQIQQRINIESTINSVQCAVWINIEVVLIKLVCDEESNLQW